MLAEAGYITDEEGLEQRRVAGGAARGGEGRRGEARVLDGRLEAGNGALHVAGLRGECQRRVTKLLLFIIICIIHLKLNTNFAIG
jgi:hypothetical protein